MNDFKNLNDIFNDSDFEHLIAPLKPMKKINYTFSWLRNNSGSQLEKNSLKPIEA